MKMKNLPKITLTCLLLFSGSMLFAQQKLGDNLGNHTATQNVNMATRQLLNTSGVVIGSATPLANTSIALQIGNSTQAIVISSVAANANIVTPVNGMIIYNSTDNKLYLYQAGAWVAAMGTQVTEEFSATAAQTSFTLPLAPAATSTVKMYVNGVKISKIAYSISGVTVTYIPANNGAYALVATDRIQFDYSH